MLIIHNSGFLMMPKPGGETMNLSTTAWTGPGAKRDEHAETTHAEAACKAQAAQHLFFACLERVPFPLW